LIIIDYILGTVFQVGFILSLLVFQPIQIIAYNVFGYQAQQKMAQLLNGVILFWFKVAGTKVKLIEKYHAPTNQPIIFVANHQSLWDIVGIYWHLRKYNPVFVSKLELAKGIPSISYNLRKSKAALINRKDKKQAISEILRLSSFIETEKRAAVIFPEGTRSKNGQLKLFAFNGLAALIKKAPSAILVPMAIRGTCDIEASKRFRIHAFRSISWTILPPIDKADMDPKELANQLRNVIKEELESQL